MKHCSTLQNLWIFHTIESKLSEFICRYYYRKFPDFLTKTSEKHFRDILSITKIDYANMATIYRINNPYTYKLEGRLEYKLEKVRF